MYPWIFFKVMNFLWTKENTLMLKVCPIFTIKNVHLNSLDWMPPILEPLKQNNFVIFLITFLCKRHCSRCHKTTSCTRKFAKTMNYKILWKWPLKNSTTQCTCRSLVIYALPACLARLWTNQNLTILVRHGRWQQDGDRPEAHVWRAPTLLHWETHDMWVATRLKCNKETKEFIFKYQSALKFLCIA